ncbi:MAG: hypothetical protein QOJ54_3120, partial [Aliidongia sp.]|nr:hypothetical protein [Aliidongia sp.]
MFANICAMTGRCLVLCLTVAFVSTLWPSSASAANLTDCVSPSPLHFTAPNTTLTAALTVLNTPSCDQPEFGLFQNLGSDTAPLILTYTSARGVNYTFTFNGAATMAASNQSVYDVEVGTDAVSPDTVTAFISNQGLASDTAIDILITVGAPLAAPTTAAVSQTMPYDSGATPITLILGGGPAASVAVAAAATHGTATASGTTISYTPTTGFFGTDSFTYTATNATTTSSAATVSITVSPPVISVTPTALAAGTVGTSYSHALTPSGGQAPYSFATTLA